MITTEPSFNVRREQGIASKTHWQATADEILDASANDDIDFRYVDLSDQSLEYSRLDVRNRLSCICFENAILNDTRFSSADLSFARFGQAECEGTLFDNAQLTHASFKRATLIGADFRYAQLYSCSFTEADLTAADFRWAQFGERGFDVYGALSLAGAQGIYRIHAPHLSTRGDWLFGGFDHDYNLVLTAGCRAPMSAHDLREIVSFHRHGTHEEACYHAAISCIEAFYAADVGRGWITALQLTKPAHLLAARSSDRREIPPALAVGRDSA